MSVLTRRIALLSSGVAVLVTAYAGAFDIRVLPAVCLIAAVAAALLSRLSVRAALVLGLPPVYLSPVIFLLIKGHDHYAYNVLWMSGLLGVIAGTGAGAWSVPQRWRWPIATWATLIAVSWPLVAWRALDFTWPFVWDNKLPVVPGVSGPGAVAWTAYTAAIHLVGLLWIDWLFRTYERADRRFRREVFTPLALTIVLACLVGLYQAFADIGFLSGHLWPMLLRAAGTSMDANIFGMLAALWAPIFLVLTLEGSLVVVTLGGAGFVLAWLGTWASGSRTALLAALVGTVVAAIHIPYRWRVISLDRKSWRLASTGLIAGFVAVLLLGPSVSRSALDRAKDLVPTRSWESVRATAWALWDRDGYGQAAAQMISEHPLTGVGPGAYYHLVSQYLAPKYGTVLPDNAQNWFRHQAAELGIIGSVGWVIWTAVLTFDLWPRRRQTGPGALLRGPLLGFALASMLGVPGQDPAVVVTFWFLVFWCASDTTAVKSNGQIGKLGSIAVLLLAGSFTVATARATDLRPPYLAARFGWRYGYGFSFDGATTARAERHGVTVQTAQGPWMKLSYWVEHPDADSRLVKVEIWRDRDRVVSRRMSAQVPATVYVSTPGAGKRFVLETRVDRTWTDADARERGLAMKWEFVEKPPPGADVVQR